MMGWIRRMLGGGLTEDDVERMELARDVKGLIKCLEDGDMYIRFCAVMALGEIGDARAVEPLSKALGDEDWAVRLHAVEALGKIGDARAEEPLIKALRDEDWKVRRDAVKVLGSIGGENVVEALIEALSDKNGNVRRSAARALGEIGDERAIGALTKALNDRTKAVPPAAKKALKKIGGPRSVEAMGELNKKEPKRKVKKNNKSKKTKTKPQAVDPLKRKNKTKPPDAPTATPMRPRHVGTTTEDVERMKSAGDVEGLIEALNDDYTFVRKSAVEALGKIGEPVVEPLIKALGDEDRNAEPFIRETVEALGKIGEAALKPLIKALGDEEWQVRTRVVAALGQIGDARAAKPFVKALGDEHGTVRANAAYALGFEGIGDARAVKPLIRALGDEDEHVRGNAAWALGRIGEPAVEPLIRALGNDNEVAEEDVRAAAAEALGWVSDARAVKPLNKLLEDEDEESVIHQIAVWALRRFESRGREGIGGARAVEPLVWALEKDFEEAVRQKAAESLDALGWEPDTGMQIILNKLKSKDWEERLVAVGTLDEFMLLQPVGYSPLDIEDSYQEHFVSLAPDSAVVEKYRYILDYHTTAVADKQSLKNFDTAVKALIDILTTEEHTDVIFTAGMNLCFHFSVSMQHRNIPHPFNDGELGAKYRSKVVDALVSVSDKAADIAIQCGAKRTEGGGFFGGTPNRGIKWGGTANNPRIDVSKCPWKVKVEDKKWVNQTYAETLTMIVNWEEI